MARSVARTLSAIRGLAQQWLLRSPGAAHELFSPPVPSSGQVAVAVFTRDPKANTLSFRDRVTFSTTTVAGIRNQDHIF